MSEISTRNAGAADPTAGGSATTIIAHRPLKDQVAAYERWLMEIVPIAQTFAGHRGVNIIRPYGDSDAYTIVLHFDNDTRLRQWLDSGTRKRLIE